MNLFQFLLMIHIAGGSLSLLLGLYMLAAKKGNGRHKKVGKIYFYALLIASLVALPMAYLHPNYFLFIIGVFTAYMLLTGKRYLTKKSIADIVFSDWLLSFTMLLFGLGFIGLGIFNIVKGNSFGSVLLVFGMISLLFIVQDWRNYTGRSTFKNPYLTTHLQRMVGSYIASVTAFLVVNNTYLPAIVAWLLPTCLLTPLIFTWTKKYKITKTKQTAQRIETA